MSDGGRDRQTDGDTICPTTDMPRRYCARCREEWVRSDATFVLTVNRHVRAKEQPHTIHRPTCWHALNDTEPEPGDWSLAEIEVDPATGAFELPTTPFEQDRNHERWQTLGRYSRQTVKRSDLQRGQNGDVLWNGHAFKRCQRCAPVIW